MINLQIRDFLDTSTIYGLSDTLVVDDELTIRHIVIRFVGVSR